MEVSHNTFETEVDFVLPEIPSATSVSQQQQAQLNNLRKIANESKLPASINLIALRESLLSEAPFVTKGNKAFWRRMIDDACFQSILAASFRVILNSISDIGCVNITKLFDVESDSVEPFISTMAVNISNIIFANKLRERDIFFSKLPEILTFMVIEALHTSTPKHYRVYNSARFREILLDWSSEIVGGIRLSRCRLAD